MITYVALRHTATVRGDRGVRALATTLAAAVCAVLPLAAVSACAAQPRTGSIAGTIKASRGGGSTCTGCLTPVRGRLLVIPRGGTSYWGMNSGVRGRFYTVVPAGPYVVKVVRPQGCGLTKNVRVRADKTTLLQLLCPDRSG